MDISAFKEPICNTHSIHINIIRSRTKHTLKQIKIVNKCFISNKSEFNRFSAVAVLRGWGGGLRGLCICPLPVLFIAPHFFVFLDFLPRRLVPLYSGNNSLLFALLYI